MPSGKPVSAEKGKGWLPLPAVQYSGVHKYAHPHISSLQPQSPGAVFPAPPPPLRERPAEEGFHGKGGRSCGPPRSRCPPFFHRHEETPGIKDRPGSPGKGPSPPGRSLPPGCRTGFLLRSSIFFSMDCPHRPGKNGFFPGEADKRPPLPDGRFPPLS